MAVGMTRGVFDEIADGFCEVVRADAAAHFVRKSIDQSIRAPAGVRRSRQRRAERHGDAGACLRAARRHPGRPNSRSTWRRIDVATCSASAISPSPFVRSRPEIRRQHLQRRLQAVREIAGARAGRGDLGLAGLSQGVYLRRQRHDLVREPLAKPARLPSRIADRRARTVASGRNPTATWAYAAEPGRSRSPANRAADRRRTSVSRPQRPPRRSPPPPALCRHPNAEAARPAARWQSVPRERSLEHACGQPRRQEARRLEASTGFPTASVSVGSCPAR